MNAGILSFAGSLWLIFGANVGTTMTGWLVALIGLKIKVELFALPMIGIGVIFQMINKKALGALGSILTGFGILFLGIGFLQESFKNVETLINLHAFVGHGIWSLFAFLFAGIFLSVVTQSSTVATMIILTLANTVGLPIEQSAAAVIGANVGTTVTAAFASIGATANAKRAAWAHIIFNIVAGIVAFAILPVFMWSLDWVMDTIGLEDTVATQLALFHTAFNILGAILMIPLAKYIASFLSKCFTESDIHIEKPKYLDETLLSAPSLAIESLTKELDRYRDILITSLRGFLAYMQEENESLPKINKLDELSEAITLFITQLTQSSMSDEVAERLAECLTIRDQYTKSTQLLKFLISEHKNVKHYNDPMDKELNRFLSEADALLEYIDTPTGSKPKSISNRKLEDFEVDYRKFKSLVTKSAVVEVISVRDMEAITTLVRILKRMIRSFAKAQRVNIPVGAENAQ